LDFVVLVLSAILKVKRAPLVVLYSYTIDKLFPSNKIILEQKSIAFAHTVGAIFSLLGLIFIKFGNPVAGWILIGVLALLKTSAAFGFCGAAKLYTCLNNPDGQCCRVGKRVKRIKDGEGFK
jgi:urea transporter